MPEYLHPGVYVEEIERGPRPIEGVPTSTAAFLGETERGPIRPRLVTSYNDYRRLFGGVFRADAYMPYASNGFFENGGKSLYVCRIVPPDAQTASRDFGNNFFLRAIGAGAWGNRIYAAIEDSSTKDSSGAPVGFRLKVAYWANVPNNFTPYDPFNVDNRMILPRPALLEDFDDLSGDPASPDYYTKRLGTEQNPNSALVFLNGGTAVPPAKPNNSAFDFLQNGSDGSAITSADYTGLPASLRTADQGIAALTLDEFRDIALVYAPHPAVAGPKEVNTLVKDHCELSRFRFAVMDSLPNQSDPGSVNPRDSSQWSIDSSYAAIYYPWLYVSDPQTGARVKVPPGGYALGVYARTDTDRGVFKAPANEIARGVLDLEYDINDKQQDTLNPRGVNAIRKFPGRGIRIWGARTLTSNALWKYVSVRRLFIFLERSIYEGTQWVVFEPNDYALWARVKDTIRLFLRSQWRQGALFGRTEDEAFFITCDKTTMSQDDILNGRLICEIGIAPVRPAEFVIFRIFQQTAEAQR
ncbi:MAG TPA: phage tail sheath family protein [Povalibacter sp.]|uniref:phage tail sheath family protein n=1 Tax=Povalibacter sp. TaxID=1962978 RepID=UPI002C38136D|nr:phage tail sheath family protein [Povalibacter sp.]HMN44667.1 phage tail sheath family protein [Povalibacter sp.]